MRAEQLAISSVSNRPNDLETILAAYEGAGFVNVEFTLKHVYDYLEIGHTLQDVERLLRGHGLTCIGGFESVVTCFASEEEQVQNHNRIVDNCRLLAELGGSSLVMGTDGPDQTQECVDPIGEIAGVMGKL